MATLKDFFWLADKSKWEAATAKINRISPFTDPGIAGGCDKIGTAWKMVKWDRLNAAATLKANTKPEQLANPQFARQVRAQVQAEYKKVEVIAHEIAAQAGHARKLLDAYGSAPMAYMPVLSYAKQVIAEAAKFGPLAGATEKTDLAALDKVLAEAADAHAKDMQQDMQEDEKRIRDAATARLAATGAVMALDKHAHLVADTLAKATAAAANKKTELAALMQQGKKQLDAAVSEMKRASVARSELEAAIKGLMAPPLAPAMMAAGKDELAKAQKVAGDMKARQEAAEKLLGDAQKRFAALAKGVR
jgi:hypothetical protein